MSSENLTGSGGDTAGGGAVLMTLLVADLVDSTRWVEELGDQRAVEVLRRHDRVARDLLGEHSGQEIDKTDGFLLLFERPIHAVRYALAYHRALTGLSRELGVALAARVGVHLGEVFVRRNAPEDVARGAKPVEVEGLAKLMAARLMSLAGGGQTLLSAGAFDLARRAAEDAGDDPGLVWLRHGHYRFKGLRDSFRVFEVGRRGEAPLAPPADSEKAQREDQVGDLPTASLPRPRRRPRWVAALAAVLALTAGIGWFVSSRRTAGASGEFAFAARDWVVVGDFANLTRETLLDNSLDLALRVGLEQSRFANVLPESQVRAALTRMQRADTAVLDRTLGSEVCLREGAKALILGSITELGKTYSVSAEIIDPRSGSTIGSETASAQEQGEILEALGQVVRSLRERLGESLKEIEETTVPLEKVTTSNLEALKAYSLGLEKAGEGKQEEAVRLLERAIELDPGFAAAHAKLGTVYFNFELGLEKAAHHWDLALAHSDRLAEREKLYVEGSQAWHQPDPERMLRPWYLLSSLYPDMAVGHNNYGLVSWWYLNRYDEAAEALGRSCQAKDPWVFSSFHHRGYNLLAVGRTEEALASFETSWEMSRNPLNHGKVDALVLLGRYAEAELFLRDNQATTVPAHRLEGRMRGVALQLHQGRVAAAAALAAEAAQEAKRAHAEPAAVRARVAATILDAARGVTPPADRSLAVLLDERLRELPSPPAAPPFGAVPRLVVLGRLAYRQGDQATGQRALDAVGRLVADSPMNAWHAWHQLLAAEGDLAAGRPAAALGRLREALATLPLFAAHETLARAHEAAGDLPAARAERRWLREHRGVAFAEWVDRFFGREGSILDSLLAPYHEGRLAEAAGDATAARAAYQEFVSLWQAGDGELAELVSARARLAVLGGAQAPGGA